MVVAVVVVAVIVVVFVVAAKHLAKFDIMYCMM